MTPLRRKGFLVRALLWAQLAAACLAGDTTVFLPGTTLLLSGDISVAVDASGTTANILTESVTLPVIVAPGAGLELAVVPPAACQTQLLSFATILCTTKADFTGVQVYKNSINISTWLFANRSYSNLSIFCTGLPPATAVASCAGRQIFSNSTLVPALISLQATHSNVTLHLSSSAPYWITPEFGWGTTDNPTVIQGFVYMLSDSPHAYTWFDFRASGSLISVPDNATLKFRRIATTNMNLGSDTQFPASGFIGYYFNIQRGAGVRFSSYESINVLPRDVFDYMAYWYARYLSSISSISASAQWLADSTGLPISLSTFQLAPTEHPDTIYTVVKRVSNFDIVNQTIVPDSLQHPLLPAVQHTGIMDWGVDPFTPTTQATPACQPAELLRGLNFTQAQPYVIQVCNMRLAAAAESTNASQALATGAGGNPSSAQGLNASPPFVSIPAGTAIWWQGHPMRSLAADLAGQASAVVLGAGSQLTIRNLTLVNAGTQMQDPTGVAPPHPLQLFSMLLWAIGNSSADISLVLDLVTIIVPPEELAILKLFARGQRTCSCSLGRETQAALTRIFDMSEVSLLTNTSVTFSRVRAERWSGARVTLSSDPSPTPFYLLPGSALADVTLVASSSGRKRGVDVRWVVPTAVLGGLAVLAGLLAVVWLMKRRRSLQTHSSDIFKVLDTLESGKLHPAPSSPAVDSGTARQLLPGSSGALHRAGQLQQSASSALDASDPSLATHLVATTQPQDPQWMGELDDPDVAVRAAQLIAGYTNSSLLESIHGSIPEEEDEGGEDVAAAAAATTTTASGPVDSASTVQGLVLALEGHRSEAVNGAVVQNGFGGAALQLRGSSFSHSRSRCGPGTKSWGVSSGLYEESSMGMVSDSFDRPGSEYGEWRPIAPNESEHMLQKVRSEVGAGGKLVISGVLGAGAHAVVYKGEWRGWPVAVKCLLFQEHRIHTKRQALQEAAINTRLAHPNIVNTYTFELRAIGANADGSPTLRGSGATAQKDDSHMSIAEDQAVAGDWKMYIVQEYCDGGHLKRAVDTGALTMDGVTPNMLTVVNTALDIACGVQHIHSKNIIHGDLSPANILLKLDDSRVDCLRAVAKVGDFGLSHMSKDGQSHVSNARQGTPYYTAPEVFTEGHMTKAADVYSFGVILHELYCGQPAWRRRHRAATPAHAAASGVRGDDAINTQGSGLTGQLSTGTDDIVEGSGSGQTQLAPAAVQQQLSDTATLTKKNSTPSTVPVADNPLPATAATIARVAVEGTGRNGAAQAAHPDSQDQAQQISLPAHTSPLVQPPTPCPSTAPTAVSTPAPAPCTVLHDPVITRTTMRALQRYAMAPDQFRSCPLAFPAECPRWYAQLAAACMASRPEQRPKLFDVVKLLLVQQKQLAKEAASQATAPDRLPLLWSLRAQPG